MLTNLLTIVVAVAAAPSPALNWENDYGKALTQVRADDRPLLVVLDKPGQEIEAKMLSPKSNAVLRQYDLCRVDVSTKYGKQVAEAFKAKTFPHVAFVDKAGKVILHTQKGKVGQDQWANALARYKSGVQPQRHVVMRPTTQSQPVNYYQPSSSCPNCQRGF